MIDNLVAYEFFKDADYYGICETAANTAAKVVTIPDFTLENGVGVMVKFKNNNTTNSPTLNVSGTGAKPIYIDPSVGTSVSWEAWKVLSFVYDGTNWQLVCDPGIAVTQIPTDDSDNNYEVLFSKSPDNLEHMEEVRKSKYLNYNPNQRTLFVNDGNETAPTETTTDLLVSDENWVWVEQEGSVAWSDNYIVFGVSSQYDGSNSLEKVIYTGGIPKTVKKIRYSIYEQYKKYGTDVDHQLCVGIKTVRNYYAMPSDTDFVIKNLHDFTASGDNIIGELNVDLDTDPNIQYYLYIIANSWGATVTQLDLVEYSNSIYNRGYISNNSLGVIKTSNNVATSLKVKDNDIILSGTGNTWDGSNTSLKTAVGNINNNISNLIKAQTIDFPVMYFGQNMNLDADGVNWKVSDHIDTGYKFLCWQVCGSTDFTIESPICITNPLVKAGNPIWDTPSSVPANGRVKFTFFEILDL